jgi:hypothetical protein
MAAKDTAPDMQAKERHVYGPRPIGALVPGVTRAAFRRRAPGTAQVLADWPQIVGPALAAVTFPRRLTAGALTIACSGPIALELQHLTGELIARINTALGSRVVNTLRFVQIAPLMPPPLPARPVPPEVAARAESEVDGLADDGLRTALAALGRAVFGASDRGSRLARGRDGKTTTY